MDLAWLKPICPPASRTNKTQNHGGGVHFVIPEHLPPFNSRTAGAFSQQLAVVGSTHSQQRPELRDGFEEHGTCSVWWMLSTESSSDVRRRSSEGSKEFF